MRGAPVVRIRLLLPSADETVALSLSAAAHLALIAILVPFGGSLGSSGPPRPVRPVMAVDLTASARPAPEPARRRPEPREPEPAPEKPPEPKPRPKRTEVDAPKAVVERPEGTTAQPEELPQAEPLPPSAEDAAGEPAEDGGADAGDVTGVAATPGGLFDDDAFQASWYERLVVARLQDAWRDRPPLPAGREPLRAVVSFRILSSGEVRDVDVVIPSGYDLLDLSARRTVESLRRLPPLPRDYGEDSVRARCVFVLVPGGPR